eukprot:1430361-Rhodomonas_salina.6
MSVSGIDVADSPTHVRYWHTSSGTDLRKGDTDLPRLDCYQSISRSSSASSPLSLRKVLSAYAVGPGTSITYAAYDTTDYAIGLRTCYALSGTRIAYAAILLCTVQH